MKWEKVEKIEAYDVCYFESVVCAFPRTSTCSYDDEVEILNKLLKDGRVFLYEHEGCLFFKRGRYG